MSAPPLRIDDLEALAREGWRLGALYCGCNGYHQIWGLLRQAGVVRGTRLDEPILTPLLAGLLTDGMEVLIAGAADPAQLALLACAGGGKRLQVTVIDRCAAPLALIAELAPPAGVSVETVRADLSTFGRREAWDLILSHSMLPFVPPDQRGTLMRRLHAALRPQGRLVLVVRTSTGLTANELAQHDEAWLDQARGKLSACPLPAPFEDVEPLLRAHAASRAVRAATLPTPAATKELLRAAGFRILEVTRGLESTALVLDGRRVAGVSYVFVAAPA